MERGGPRSIWRTATHAQVCAARTLASGHARLAKLPSTTGECDTVGRHPQPRSRYFPCSDPNVGEGRYSCALRLVEIISRYLRKTRARGT
jgi:hypothetical protein